MGIFDFLKPKKSNSLTEIWELEDNKLDAKLKELQRENKAWEKDFNHVIALREKAAQFEKNQEYSNAIETYIESIEFGEKSVKLNFANYAHDIERMIILYGKTKQTEKQIEFLKRMINTYLSISVQDSDKWKIRLSKLTNNSGNKSFDLTANKIVKPKSKENTIGKQLNEFKKLLPEFNFYHNMSEDMQTFEYLSIYKPVPFEKSKELRAFKEKFDSILTKAQIAENDGDFKTAIETYLDLIAEEYEGKEPFERLLIIYKKLKWEDEEYSILIKAIEYFGNLRTKQRKEVIALAKKYQKEEKALEYINADKKIQYYGGSFDLYNPYPIITKWKEKLEKIETKIKTKTA